MCRSDRAGPAGISCACELRLNGFEVDIYEAKEKPSGLTLTELLLIKSPMTMH
ncbi:MAG: NAD(P)-binding protein [Ignavibacteria bacterium]